MTGEIFLTLLNKSITTGWLVLAILVLRLLLKKAPKALFTALWALVAIRLLCPVSFQSRFSLIQNAEPIPQELAGDIWSMEEPENPLPAADGDRTQQEHREKNAAAIPEKDDAAGQKKPWPSVLSAAAFIWLAGVAGMLSYSSLSYWRISGKVKESMPLQKNVLICDRIDTPFILGVFRPRIYLPSTVSETDIIYVLAHEKAHLKRRDHIWKPLGFILLSVYWFQPLLWLSYVLFCRDIELACDEKVIRELGEESKKPYSGALINCSVPRRVIAACPIAFGETGVKRRIQSVLKYKKPTFWIILTAAAVFVVVGICFLTNPRKDELPVAVVRNDLKLTLDTAAEGRFNDSHPSLHTEEPRQPYLSSANLVSDAGDLSELSDTVFIPTAVGGRVTFTGNTAAPSEARVGDTVLFGSYEQDNDTENGKEAIEWLVLDKQDGKLLLLSKYALDAMPWNDESEKVSWETCTLREWLNETFYNTAFSQTEQEQIAVAKVKNKDILKPQSGNDTEDSVFLLSTKEATRYFYPESAVADPARRAEVTEYAKAQGAGTDIKTVFGVSEATTEYDGNGCWWLRSLGDFNYGAAYIGFSGCIGSGYTVVGCFHVVRPAVWLTPEP